MNPRRKIRVLVVDDSAVVRRAIADTLSADPEIEVVGTACDPYVAKDKIIALEPDVLTLDIEMPRMDGLTFLQILQERRPIPVVIISSTTQAGSEAALRALEYGAVDVLAKPGSAMSLGNLRDKLARCIKNAARTTLRRVPAPTAGPRAPVQIANPGPALSPAASPANPDPRPTSGAAPIPARPANPLPSGTRADPRQLIVIGSSTGGTQAVRQILTQLPADLPGICIVQHIPPVFSKAFAQQLNSCCALQVREAVSGDEIRPGLVLVAPGDFHLVVRPNGGRYSVVLNQDPPVHHTRPAVDLLFQSAAACAGRFLTGILLTGMGTDGALGMQRIRLAGGATIAQHESTCVVYGMPRAAIELGVVDHVLPLDQIAPFLVRSVRERAHRIATAPPPSRIPA